MNEHFWKGFEKQAISLIPRAAATVGRMGQNLANWGSKLTTGPVAGKAARAVGGFVRKNPLTSAGIGAGAAGLGAAKMLGSKPQGQTVNIQ